MQTILPVNPSKYKGYIRVAPNGNYIFRTYINGVSYCKTLISYEEIIQYQKDFCLEHGLIKNLLYDCGDHYEMDLTQGKRAKFDKEDFNKVDKYTWYASRAYTQFYCKAKPNFRMHNIIMDHDDNSTMTVDHINKDGLDNRKINLRIVDKQTQSINRKKQKNNTSGYVGVYNHGISWQAIIQDTNGNSISKYFSTRKYGCDTLAKIEAIKWRKQKERELEHYRTALNLNELPTTDYSDLIDDLDD